MVGIVVIVGRRHLEIRDGGLLGGEDAIFANGLF